MSFQQVIAGKVKLNGLGGIRRHMQERNRVKTNPNIDLMRSHLNYCVEGLTPDNLNHRVNERIKQLNLKKKPRSDAVGLEDIIISASVDFMLNLDPQTRENYFRDSLHFIQQRYGKENVMYCQCHLDESNPHIHIGVVPVTSDGRLSAKSLFSPKTLEQLQTDFHSSVSSNYGLERGESHSKKYLPIQQFKAQQAKLKTEQYTNDLNNAALEQEKIKEAHKTAHYATSGVIFKDRENIKMPTNQYLYLKQAAEEGVKAAILVHSLKDDISKLQHDNLIYKSNAEHCSNEWKALQEETKNYTSVPKGWRKNIDVEIDKLQKLFTKYCHDVNRMTARVYIATNKNVDKTEEIMEKYIKGMGVAFPYIHVLNVISAAKKQFKKHIKPDIPPPSWKPPKPSHTDYQQPDQTGLVDVKLVDLSGNDINWEMINWDLLSELEKDEIEHKRMLRSI